MRRRLASLPAVLYLLGVALGVPILVRRWLEPSAWWSVTLGAEALLYLLPMALWFATIKPAVAMPALERAQRFLLAGIILFSVAFLAFTLPVAFLILTGDSDSAFHSIVYLAIWLFLMLFSRKRQRTNAVEAYGTHERSQ